MNDAGAEYFRAGGDAEAIIDPENPPRYVSITDIPMLDLGAGLRFRPIFGTNMLVNYVYFDADTVAPVHQHPEEQIGTALEGEFEFELNGEKRIVRPGDFYVAPPNVPHGARSLGKPCVALDIFSPPRTGFRELLENARNAASRDEPAAGS